MPAYTRAIPLPSCDYTFCSQKATVQAFNETNAPIGNYCARHGKWVVNEYNQRLRERIARAPSY